MDCSRRTLMAVAALGVVAAMPGRALAAPPVYQRGGYALGGYDPVAYFVAGKPVKGQPAYSFNWRGATWLFSSAENQARFAANPEAYAPQYGGHCALAMTEGQKSNGDPEAWTIIKGKPYLNGSKQVQERWILRSDTNISKADSWWGRSYANQ